MRGFTASVIISAFVLAYEAPRTGGAMMAADVKKELRTAVFHASELAQRGDSVATSKLAAKVAGADEALKQANLAETLALQAMAKTTVTEVQPWAKVVAEHLQAALNALGS